jgi:hypothetical protein
MVSVTVHCSDEALAEGLAGMLEQRRVNKKHLNMICVRIDALCLQEKNRALWVA